MRLYVIRHGKTDWNLVRRLQGQTDIPLNEEGVTLARRVGQGMADISFDYAISSPLGRALQTAQLVLGDRKTPILTDQRLQEISFGEWEGEKSLESTILPPNFVEVFFREPMHYERPPKGETFQEVCDRTRDFYEELVRTPAYQEANILISTHGAAGRCFLNNFFEDKEDIWRGGVPDNCTVCVVEVTPGRSRILEMDKLYA